MNTEGSVRPLSLLALVCLVVGNMIGIGIYVSSTYSLASLKDAKLVLAIWLIAGIHALCGSVAYAAIARRLPVSGGEFAILTRWVHPSVGFIAAWISIIAGFSAPIAASAKLLGIYLVASLENILTPAGNTELWIATSVILIATFLHWIEVGLSAKVNNFVVALKLVGLSLFIVIGLRHVFLQGSSGMIAADIPIDMTGGQGNAIANSLTGAMLFAMVGSLYYTTLSYTGFNASIYLAGDYPSSHDDQNRNQNRYNLVGKSMMLACVIVTLFYLLLNVVFLYSIPAEQVVESGEKFVLAGSNAIGGSFLQQLMGWIILMSCLTSVLAMTITGPQVYLQLAREYGLFEHLKKPFSAPRLALIIQALLTMGFVWFTPLRDLVAYLGLTLTACGALAVSSIWIAVGKSDSAIRLPLNKWEQICVAIYVGGAVVLVAAGAWIVPVQFWSCVATFAVGLVLYLILVCRATSKSNGS